MTTLHSEKYYRDNWNRCLESSRVNLEEEFERNMSSYNNLPEDAVKVIRVMEAKKLIEKTEASCKDQMAMLKRILSGETSLGYTTQTQEIQAMHKLHTDFEFTCLQLADFKKTHIK